jgi:hypothetical protein
MIDSNERGLSRPRRIWPWTRLRLWYIRRQILCLEEAMDILIEAHRDNPPATIFDQAEFRERLSRLAHERAILRECLKREAQAQERSGRNMSRSSPTLILFKAIAWAILIFVGIPVALLLIPLLVVASCWRAAVYLMDVCRGWRGSEEPDEPPGAKEKQ